VVVYDKVTGLLVPGATVTATSTTGQTAPGSPGTTVNGEITFQNMVAGTYSIWVAKTGTYGQTACYVTTGTTGVPITYGAIPTKTLYITPLGSLWVRIVKNSDGSARSGWDIVITNTSGFSKTVRTDSQGNVKVPYLQAGTYTLKRSGSNTYSSTYVVSNGVIPTSATVLRW